MESEEAIMENENNSNLESETINRERDGEGFQDASASLRMSLSPSEPHGLNMQPDASSSIEPSDIGTKAPYVTATDIPNIEKDFSKNSDILNADTYSVSLQTENNENLNFSGKTTPLLESDITGTSSDASYDVLNSELQESNKNVDIDKSSNVQEIEEITPTDCDEPMDVSCGTDESSTTAAHVVDSDNNASITYASNLLISSQSSTINDKLQNNDLIENQNSLHPAESATDEALENEMSTENLENAHLKNSAVDSSYSQTETLSNQLDQRGNELKESDMTQIIKENVDQPVIEGMDKSNERDVDLIEDQINQDLMPSTTQNQNEFSKSLKCDATDVSQSVLLSTENYTPTVLACKTNKEQNLSQQQTVDNHVEDAQQGSIISHDTDVELCQSNTMAEPNVEIISNKIVEVAGRFEDDEDGDNSANEGPFEDQKEKTEGELVQDQVAAGNDKEPCEPIVPDAADQNEILKEKISEQDEAKKGCEVKNNNDGHPLETFDHKDLPQGGKSDIHSQLDSNVASVFDAEIEAAQAHEKDIIPGDQMEESNVQTVKMIDTVPEDMNAAEGLSTDKNAKTPVESINVDESAVERTDYNTKTSSKIDAAEQNSVTSDETALHKRPEGQTDSKTNVPFESMNVDVTAFESADCSTEISSKADSAEESSVTNDEAAPNKRSEGQSDSKTNLPFEIMNVDESDVERADCSTEINKADSAEESSVTNDETALHKSLEGQCDSETAVPVESMNVDESAVESTDCSTEINSKADSAEESSVTNDETAPHKRLEGQCDSETTVADMVETPAEKSDIGLEINSGRDAGKTAEVSDNESTSEMVKETVQAVSTSTAQNIASTLVGNAPETSSDVPTNITLQAETAKDSLYSKVNQGGNETDSLIEAKNIKQELMSEEDSPTKDITDARVLQMIKKEVDGTNSNNNGVGLDDEDIVVLDDDGESFPVKSEPDNSSFVLSAISGQENSFPQQAVNLELQDSPNKMAEGLEKGSGIKKGKTQTCIVCSKVCRCKYNIVRNGDIKHLCGDDCFKKFRKTPSEFLKNKDGKPTEPSKTITSTPSKPQMVQDALSKFKTCSVCQLMNVNPNQPFCNWKGLDFCGESCLGKFQANLSTTCSFCGAFISSDVRATFCLKIGNDVRIFCKSRCVTEFRKNLRLCACCQKDLSSFPGSFSAMVGSLDKKIRQFCSQTCRQKLETQLVGVEVVSKSDAMTADNSSAPQPPVSPGSEITACSVCQKVLPVQHTVRFQGKVYRLCSNLCFSAFKYTNKIGLSKCDTCGTVCTVEEAQAHYVQFEGQVKRFCSDVCVNTFRRDNNKVMSCCWCGTKKMNFDMIERLDAENKFQMFCSLNCLSLYRVNLQAKSNQAVPCDQCKMVTPAQYHLTMSDASVRNFCSYACVMTFQAQFTSKQIAPTQVIGQAPPGPQKQVPLSSKEPDQQVSKSRARIGTRNASKQNSPSFPVISNVISLAPPSGQQNEQPHPASLDITSPPASKNLGSNNTLSSGDGKHQILIQAPPVKIMKNKSLQCRPVSLTKATSCRPHSQPKETQTEKIPDKQVIVPIPVPIYIPMPTVMYSAPTPIPVPFPIPIPVPVFIPTTRNSTAGIMKTIKGIVERMPADPLEAELLMMAEAVAADKRESDSESEAENEYGADCDDEPKEAVPPSIERVNDNAKTKKKESQGEEDMIQMALRMAEEMSAPIEDLESSVEPVAVNTDPPPNVNTPSSPAYQADEDYIPPGSRGRGRGVKRSRGRPSNARSKRQRIERNYVEAEIVSPREQQTPAPPALPQQMMEPAADANYRLKFTYGVNAWRHWVIAKNTQIENSRKPNSFRVRTFPTDILKCTTDELNVSLIYFTKEVRKPNGEEYSPDSIYYLCLGIQQYLYENGRIDSIFTDSYFEKFADNLHEILKNLQPKVNAQGQMLCRIEEEHLWESKQLGAHSPFVLLNTLIYFHTKHFILKTAQEHMSLSFAQILKHWKKGIPLKGQPATGKNISLRFYCLANGKKDNLAARKSKDGVPVYEITENFDNPLRCPVKLYEFFLSKW
ncbi:zinc finger MYM-type protein 3 [Elysia marginata]|uniref:Zinc finger MYM-type protein 3 n=1 Tax=Elysia marginata TaxID=1093978 RepID=A0AAV4EHH6_9GAST|nr:zinc finger MYM-type protein 3 [Elysia marginata]